MEPAGSTSPLDRGTLSERVAALLMRQIVEQRLRPGDPLPSEAQLSAAHHVSRSVAREALRHLAALQMIQLANGKVPVVRPVTGDLLAIHFDWAVRRDETSFVELHELRRGVEGACAFHAAERRSEEDVELLRGLIAEMDAEDDHAAFVELDVRLHLAVARAAHNRLLQQIVESVRQVMGEVVRTGMESMERGLHRESVLFRLRRGHRRIVEPIVEQNPELARERMDEHLRAAVATYVAAGQGRSRR